MQNRSTIQILLSGAAAILLIVLGGLSFGQRYTYDANAQVMNSTKSLESHQSHTYRVYDGINMFNTIIYLIFTVIFTVFYFNSFVISSSAFKSYLYSILVAILFPFFLVMITLGLNISPPTVYTPVNLSNSTEVCYQPFNLYYTNLDYHFYTNSCYPLSVGHTVMDTVCCLDVSETVSQSRTYYGYAFGQMLVITVFVALTVYLTRNKRDYENTAATSRYTYMRGL